MLYFFNSTGNLQIQKVQYEDTGTYICSLPLSPSPTLPPIKEDKLFIELEVMTPAKVTKVKQPGKVRSGETVELVCEVEGSPSPRVDWFHNGQRLDTQHTGRSESSEAINRLLYHYMSLSLLSGQANILTYS